MGESDRHLGKMGQQLRFRETYYRVDASFRVRGVTRVHRHVGATRLAGIAEPNAACSRRPIAAFSLDEPRSHDRSRDHQWVADQRFDRYGSHAGSTVP